MENLRNFFWMTVLCMGFVACGGDNDKSEILPPDKPDMPSIDNEPSNKMKKLVEMSTPDETINFEYDKFGNLILATETYFEDGDFNTDTYTLEWDDDGVACYNNDDLEIYFNISNGLIISGSDFDSYESYTLKYNSNGYVTKYMQEDYDDSETKTREYIWSNGRIIRMNKTYGSDYSKIFHTFTYSDTKCNGFFPLMAGYVEDDWIFIYAIPWLIGSMQNDLPFEEIEYEGDYENRTTYSYTFYNDGYLKSCICRYSDGETELFKFVWE